MSLIFKPLFSTQLMQVVTRTYAGTPVENVIQRIISKRDPVGVEVDGAYFRSFPIVATGSTQTIVVGDFFPDQLATDKIYLAACSDCPVSIGFTNSGGAPATFVLVPTNDATQGVHVATFAFTGGFTALQYVVPTIASGGLDGTLKIFACRLPDLTDSSVYEGSGA